MPIERIASLLASGTEIVAQLGLADALVAISHECDYPPEVLDRPRVTRTRVLHERSSQEIDDQVKAMVAAGEPLYEVDADALARLRPQLIITQSQCDVCAVRYEDVVSAVRSRPELAGARVVDLNPMSLEDLERDIARVGEAAHVEDRAIRFVASLRGRLERVASAVGGSVVGGGSGIRSGSVKDGGQGSRAVRRPRVACIEWIEPLMLAANWMPQLVERTGGENLITIAGQHSRYHDWSELVAADPEIIVISPCGFDLKRTLAEAAVLANNSTWRSLSAVREGRVWAADGNTYFNRSGPRLIDSVEILAHIFHPDHVAWPLSVDRANVIQQMT